jgi:hypothetical protein
VPRSPFRLGGDGQSSPSTYVIELVLDGVRHVYGFVVDDVSIREEWLYAYPKARRRVLFEREEMTFDLGESLGGTRAKTDVLSELTRPNALFLSLAAQVGIKDLVPVYDWFVSGGIQWSDPDERTSTPSGRLSLVQALQDTSTDQHRFLSLLQAADVGIDEIVIQEEALDLPDVFPWVDRAPVSGNPGFLVRRITRENSKSELEARFARLLAQARSTIKFRHGESELFDLADESAGTRSWLSLLPQVLGALDQGGLLVIDEIDSSLHPNLTAMLIRQFQSAETNPHGAQLLFTTHDATLLGTSFGEEVLARDQIWFVEKDADGASRLYPLTDFHPRTGENRERRYLGGSYGGVPVIGIPDPKRERDRRDSTHGPNGAEPDGRASAARA